MIIDKLLLWMFSSGRPAAAKQREAQKTANRDSEPKGVGVPPRIQRPAKTFRPPDPEKSPAIRTPEIKTPTIAGAKAMVSGISVPKVTVPEVSIPKVDAPDIDLPDLGDVKITAPTMAEDGWFKQTVRNNRVFCASMIAIALFMFGGYAWSNRKPRLVRKTATAEPQTQRLSSEFDELLDIPVYKGVDPKLQNDGQSVMRTASNHLEVKPSGTVSDYDPFDALSIEDTSTPFAEQDTEFSEVFNPAEVEEVSSDGVIDDPMLQPPGLAFPDADATPTLDSGDAAPLLKIGFEGR